MIVLEIKIHRKLKNEKLNKTDVGMQVLNDFIRTIYIPMFTPIFVRNGEKFILKSIVLSIIKDLSFYLLTRMIKSNSKQIHIFE